MRSKSLISLVGAPRFELGTPSPPDWCANRAALRSAEELTKAMWDVLATGSWVGTGAERQDQIRVRPSAAVCPASFDLRRCGRALARATRFAKEEG